MGDIDVSKQWGNPRQHENYARVVAAMRSQTAIPGDYIDVVFDGPPGPESCRFVEVEFPAGASISIGEWVERPDGYWALRITPKQVWDATHD